MATQLSDDEKKIRTMLGMKTSDADFAAMRADRLTGQPMVMSARDNRPRSANTRGTGIIGPGVAAEAFHVHKAEFDDKPIDAKMLANQATAAITEYTGNPDASDAWKVLARASALLTGALDRIAPAYADRMNGAGEWR